MLVRALEHSEAELFHELRLRGLREDPGPFAATYEEDAALSLEAVRNRFPVEADRFVLGAFDDSDRLVGVVGFSREQRSKLRHWGVVWGMYVAPEARGCGTGRALMSELVARCRRLEGLEQIVLEVNTDAEPARRLYASLGFEVYGARREAMKSGDEYFDVELMVLRFAE
jgi:ribosomal protein S18 acetylase RimI-like enzyme